jgi:hypothetical protein
MFTILDFYFEYCEKKDINPLDRVKCKWYVEVTNETTDKFSAYYTYIAEWDDGYMRNGRIDAARVASEGERRVFRLTR